MSWKPASWPGALESIATGLGTTVDVVAAYVAAFFERRPNWTALI